MAAQSPQLVPEKGMDVVGSTLVYSWKLKDFAKKLSYDLQKCIGCGLCAKVCPVDAIEMGPVAEVANGRLQDTPLVMIDQEKCCYCFLCAVLCPTAALAIEVHPEGKIDLKDYPGIGLWFEVDQKKCKKGADPAVCAACEAALKSNSVKEIQLILERCPTGALKLRSPFQGEVRLLRAQLHRCDLSNCKVCFSLCPSKAIYVPQKADDVVKLGKIAIDQEKCIFCGACEACPEHLFEVMRTNVQLDKTGKIFSWTKAWTDLIQDLKASRKKQPPPQEVPMQLPQELPTPPKEGGFKKPPAPSKSEVEARMEIAARAGRLLSQAKTRRWIEQGDSDKLRAEIKKAWKEKKE